MKRFLIPLLIAGAGLFLISCSKDAVIPSIKGSWLASELKIYWDGKLVDSFDRDSDNSSYGTYYYYYLDKYKNIQSFGRQYNSMDVLYTFNSNNIVQIAAYYDETTNSEPYYTPHRYTVDGNNVFIVDEEGYGFTMCFTYKNGTLFTDCLNVRRLQSFYTTSAGETLGSADEEHHFQAVMSYEKKK